MTYSPRVEYVYLTDGKSIGLAAIKIWGRLIGKSHPLDRRDPLSQGIQCVFRYCACPGGIGSHAFDVRPFVYGRKSEFVVVI